MAFTAAKIAVSTATYGFDRPYDYYAGDLPVKAGMRVLVPFGKGNRVTEGVVLNTYENDGSSDLKQIIRLLDDEPILTTEQIQLAYFMKDRFFCTVYDAFKAMIPAGLWFDRRGNRKVRDKTVEIARLLIPGEEALSLADSKRTRSPKQSAVLYELASFGELPLRDLLLFTGASRASYKSLEKDGYVETFTEEVFRTPERHADERLQIPELNEEQNSVFSGLRNLLGSANAALLQGVTGSGKTSVYIRLIESCLNTGKSAILLVPEISLTPQMIRTFSSYFGDDVAVLHSRLSPGERYDEWKRIRNGSAHLTIGTRSAVFAPCDNLGIIIIDEEQEDTYKSENSPRYSASEVAKYRCYKSGCLLLFGSATPSVSTRYFAETGRYGYFRIESRYNRKPLPDVSVVDMKKELRQGNSTSISSFLRDEISTNIQNGEQTILFLNRRGANKLITCGECGYIYKCPNCSVSLTYHSYDRRLKCHYCGYEKKPDGACPQCGGILKYVGTGTQLVEQELNSLFPDTEVLRLDTDVLSASVTHDVLFERFRNENIPIMVGTQMLSKGLNFENVTLVGVISADQSLYSGDFRASERTFSLITQVIGRSGRGEKSGRAVIQTFTPENEVIRYSTDQDYDAFYASELEIRRLSGSPPFSDMISLGAVGMNEKTVLSCCSYFKSRCEYLLKDFPGVEILGPTPFSIVRMNNRYRYRVYIKCSSSPEIRLRIAAALKEIYNSKEFKGVSVFADSNPCD